MPTTSEWSRFKKYARRMKKLESNISEEPVPLDVLSTLQLRTLNETLLSNLKILELEEATADLIPFFPLFLSHRTTHIHINFIASPPAVMIASMIINLPKLCPYMESIFLQPLLDDATIASATSEMLLTCNLDTLRTFQVDAPLTEEANRAVYQLPNLRGLRSVIMEHTSMPTVLLPSLTELDVEYYRDHADWIRAFHEAALSKLKGVSFHAKCDRIGNFLEAFQTAFNSSASTLSTLSIFTSHSWNPSYYSLLPFKQLKELVIEFSCQDGCSSSVDDEIITALAQTMPKLEVLQLGEAPCQTLSNVTIQGLITLAHRCPCLSKLRIHFQTHSLVVALASEVMLVPSDGLPQGKCTLEILEVGEISIPQQHALPVSFALLCIFPHLLLIEYINEEWKWVAECIRLSKIVGSLVHRSGKMHTP